MKKTVGRLAKGFSKREKHIMTALIIALLLVPVFLAVQFRSYTYTLPAADSWAQTALQQSIRNSLSAEINKQYPLLPEANRQQLVEKQLADFVQQHKAEIDAQSVQVAEQFRAKMENDEGHTYLPDLDPYHFLKRTEQYLDHGYVGNEIVNGQTRDRQILAPVGIETHTDLFTWIVAHGYKLSATFTDTKPMYTLFWINLVFVGLATTLMLLIGRHKGWVAAFFAALIIAVHPSNISRTAAGVGDTESLILFFSLFAAWGLIEAFETKLGDWKRLGIFLSICGIAFGLLSLAWEWWFFFLLFLASLFAHFVFQVIRHFIQKNKFKELFKNEQVRWAAIMPVSYFVITGIFVSIFNKSANAFFSSFGALLHRTETIKAATTNGIWPNILTTVAELNEPNIATIIGTMGGKLLFITALLGLIFSLLPKGNLKLKDWGLLIFGLIVGLFLVSPKGTNLSIIAFLAVFIIPLLAAGILSLWDSREKDIKYALVLVAWLAASIFAMTKGVRFISLIIPPFAIAVAIALNSVYLLAKQFFESHTPKMRIILVPAVFILLCLPLMPMVKAGHQAGVQSVPSIDDGWWNALAKINSDAAPDAIITSWWDFGHWFRYVANRGVTFDGASQYGELAHFIGRALSTPDQRETLALLRLVDCSSNTAATKVQEYLPSHDQYEAIALMKQIIMTTHSDARSILLSKGMNSEQSDEILALTHCDPPESYFITSEDMTGKAGVWAHFGEWDFRKADSVTNFYGKAQKDAIPQMVKRYGIEDQSAAQWLVEMRTQNTDAARNSWISPWPSYVIGQTMSCQATADKNAFKCPMNLGLQSQSNQQYVLDSAFINISNMSDSHFIMKVYSQSTVVAETKTPPKLFVVMRGNDTITYTPTGENQLFAATFDADTRQILLSDPTLAGGSYTRLFFFEGKGMSAFTKFTEERTLSGGRVVVWKVDWSQLKELGLE